MSIVRDDFDGSITTLWNTSAGDTWDTSGSMAFSNILEDNISFIGSKAAMARVEGAYIEARCLVHAMTSESCSIFWGAGTPAEPGGGYFIQVSWQWGQSQILIMRTDTWAIIGQYAHPGNFVAPLTLRFTFGANNDLLVYVNEVLLLTVTNNTLFMGENTVYFRPYNALNTTRMIDWYDWVEYGAASTAKPWWWMEGQT